MSGEHCQPPISESKPGQASSPCYVRSENNLGTLRMSFHLSLTAGIAALHNST
jgi:hypothetical protein